MKHLHIAFIVLLALACNPSEKASSNLSLWKFSPQNHEIAFDKACQPLLVNYQDMLKGVVVMDTAYLYKAAKNLVILIDSFPNTSISKDTLSFININQGLVSIKAEIEGLLLEPSWPEIYKSSNMISIQLIHLLGNAGYQEHTIYIYSVNSDLQEDGLNWFAITKSSRNPYQPNKNEQLMAQQVLQEN
jgi:hypothetical protein